MLRTAELATFPIWKIAGRGCSFSWPLFSAGKVSRKRVANQTKLTTARQKLITAAKEKGDKASAALEPSDQSHELAYPPNAGPSTKPNPNAMPTIAIPLDRSFLEVTSAMDAVATDRLPLAIPPIVRERTKTQKLPAMIHNP